MKTVDFPLPESAYLTGLRNQNPVVLRQIYKKFFPSLRTYVTSHGGSTEDGEDVFQDAMVVLYRKAQQVDFVLTSSFHTYLFAVGKRIWLSKASKKGKKPQTDLTGQEFAISDDVVLEMEQTEKYRFFREKLSQMGEDCQKVLRMFFNGERMKAIAQHMGYASEGYAKKRKFMCAQKLTSLIKSDPRFSEMRAA